MFNGGDGRYLLSKWGTRMVNGVPFDLVDPANKTKNMILLHGPLGAVSRTMPREVSIPVGHAARAIHLLSGVSGWGYPYSRQQSVSMTVRLVYEDETTEDHELVNGRHFADYIRRTEVPESEYAFNAGSHQMRYLAVYPKKATPLDRIELVKGPDRTAPMPCLSPMITWR